VYCYRNPLDQAVSFFRHVQNHNDPKHRYYVDSDGKQCLIKNVREYIFNVDLEEIQERLACFGLSLDNFDTAHASVEQIVS